MLPLLFCFAVKFSVTHIQSSICIFKFITGHDCIGCGMTRALNEILNLNFASAYAYNPRVFIVAPLLVVVWVQTLNIALKENKKYHYKSGYVEREE